MSIDNIKITILGKIILIAIASQKGETVCKKYWKNTTLRDCLVLIKSGLAINDRVYLTNKHLTKFFKKIMEKIFV
jgi:hypothetical protein